ncbi:MAG: GntR family transcriptional regulator [Mesorhizobium sp.]|nr:GntR family transcriptional regulator [Mesorhizobium sp.]MBL8579949.1 GntR family transcriptional regulator [Mesorhizobium sp.]
MGDFDVTAPRSTTDRRNGAISPLYEVIYDVLQRHMSEAAFPPGLVLGETSVARAFGASRVPAAAALRRLHGEGAITEFEGRGYIVPGGEPLRLDLADAGLVLPPDIAGTFATRNRHRLIHPQVEHEIAASLPYGRFVVNESALAEHYGVSRTVAHEVLTRLERSGLISRDSNRRWYAGPLDEKLLREHYEVRWLLEPTVLGQVAPSLDRAEIENKIDLARQAASAPPPPAILERLERDLHVDIVLRRCPNQQLRETIRRSQLPVIATHSTFAIDQTQTEISRMIDEHLEIFEHLLHERHRKAASALEAHLRRSLGSQVGLLIHLRQPPVDSLPKYLTPMPSWVSAKRP